MGVCVCIVRCIRVRFFRRIYIVESYMREMKDMAGFVRAVSAELRYVAISQKLQVFWIVWFHRFIPSAAIYQYVNSIIEIE